MKPSEHLRRASTAPILVFQRRTERLDWRRIASLDIEKLIQDGDPDQLEEFISPILFCKAESEFDLDRTDPGFIKVFRLSQLIGEYFLFCCDKDKDKLKSFESKCMELEVEKVKLVEEITSLRDSLVVAKKELKKRKDLLALTQNEALGSNNQDEFDQCPYCPKRFLTPLYLHAHMQRRHQGLPVPFNPINIANQKGPLQQVYQQLQYQQQQQNFQTQPQISNSKVDSTPTVYAFRMSPNGNVRENVSNLLSNSNTNIISSECNLNIQQGRRESSTQTLITIESEGEIRNEFGNIISLKNSTTTFPSTPESQTPVPSSQEVVTVIKSPGILVGPSSHRLTHTNEQNVGSSETRPESVSRSVVEIESENASGYHVSKIDLNAICDLVEKYLEQKSVASQNQHYDKILASIQQNRDQRDQFVGDNLLMSRMLGSRSSSPSGLTTSAPNNVSNITTGVTLMALGTSSRDNVVAHGHDALKTAVVTTAATAASVISNGFPASRKTSTEMVEENVMRMKDEFESQWTHLSEKVRDSGIDQLKGTFLTEIKKVQEIILKSPGGITQRGFGLGLTQPTRVGLGVTQRDRGILDEEGEVKNDEVLLGLEDKEIDIVEQRLKRQEDMMEEMHNTLQSKMQEELQMLRSQLNSQESVWRSKLQSIELEHKNEIIKLLQDPHAKVKTKSNSSNSMIPGTRTNHPYPPPPTGSPSSCSSQLSQPPSSPAKDIPVENTSIEGLEIENVINSNPPEDAFVGHPSQSPSNSTHIKSSIQKSLNSNSRKAEDANFSIKTRDIANVPIAKPRKIKSHPVSRNSGQQQINEDSLTSNTTTSFVEDCHKSRNENATTNTNITKYSSSNNGASGFGKDSKDSSKAFMNASKVGGGSGIINQASQMPHEVRLIPSDSAEEEPEYLTIIHLEESAAPHINPTIANFTNAFTTTTNIKRKPGPNPNTVTKASRSTKVKALTGTQPQVHEYEEPLNVLNNSELVSDYTFSASEDDSDEEDYSDEEGCVESCNSKGGSFDYHQHKGDHAERSSTSGMKRSRRGRKYIFDSKNGKLIDAGSNLERQEMQMNLMREKTSKEIDNQMEELGINPKASTIGIDEMARALKHMKATRRGSGDEDPERSQIERDSLKREVNYETTKRSIHKKLDKYGALNPRHTGSSPLAKMFSKVKKSGNNWKTKVTSVMKRKRKSPSKGISKSTEPDIKTSFFSKSRWGRKNSKKSDPIKVKNEDKSKMNPQDGSEHSSEDEDDGSSVDYEMPPYMTKSGPILRKSDRQKRNAPTVPTSNVNKMSQQTSETQDDFDYDYEDIDEDEEGNMRQHSQKIQQKNPHQNGVMKELKARLKKQLEESPTRIPKPNSPGKPSKSPAKKPEYKGPNFFVNGSPPVSKVAQVQVTSNGWSTKPRMDINTSLGTVTNTSTNTNTNTPTSLSTNPSSENKNGKKPFRRDLLKEFQEAENKSFQNNNTKNRKSGDITMPIVQEEQEGYSSSETCCSSYEKSRSRRKNNGVLGTGQIAYDDDDEEYDDSRKIVREGSQSFYRSDGNRKGFRSRRSSCTSYSDSDDGRGKHKNSRKRTPSPRRSLEDRDQYVSLKHPSRPKTPPASKPRQNPPNPPNAKSGETQGQMSPPHYSGSESDTTVHSSDTSVWESEEDDENDQYKDDDAKSLQSPNGSRDLLGNSKLHQKKSPRASGQEIGNNISSRNMSTSSQHKQPSYSGLITKPSSRSRNSSHAASTAFTTGLQIGSASAKSLKDDSEQVNSSGSKYYANNSNNKKYDDNAKRGPKGKEMNSRKSPLNNSWDSD